MQDNGTIEPIITLVSSRPVVFFLNPGGVTLAQSGLTPAKVRCSASGASIQGTRESSMAARLIGTSAGCPAHPSLSSSRRARQVSL